MPQNTHCLVAIGFYPFGKAFCVGKHLLAPYKGNETRSDRHSVNFAVKAEQIRLANGRMPLAKRRLDAVVHHTVKDFVSDLAFYGINALSRRLHTAGEFLIQEARKAEERLVQLVNANFGPGDLFVTCTYARDRQPEDLTRAGRNMRNYMARIRRLCERRGSPAPRYIYVTEVKEKKRGVEYHHHLILQADVTRDEAEALWEKAGHGHANTKSVKRMKEGLIGLGKYMAKQVCSTASADGFVSRHRWCASKGLRLPQATEADRKISRRRVERIAEEMERDPVVARAHLERCYPGYEVLEMAVRTSKWVTGAYVRAVMVRRE